MEGVSRSGAGNRAGAPGRAGGGINVPSNTRTTPRASNRAATGSRGNSAFTRGNSSAGQTRANNAVVQVGGGGFAGINIQNDSAGPVHFILDVNGYFQ